MTEQESSSKWKVIALIFIILFILENLFFIWASLVVIKEEDKTKECYYDICGEYPDALYEEEVCYCYESDFFGDLIIAKTEYMK